MFKSTMIAATALVSLTLAVPVAAQDSPSAGTVLATVNGEDITLGHVIALRDGLSPQYDQFPDDVLFDGILNQLIEQTLLSQSDFASVNDTVDILMQNHLRSLLSDQAIQRITTTSIDSDEIQAFYDENYTVGTDPEFNASHILVETQEEAQAIVQELEEGANFAQLARQKSTGPSGPNGGELGWFGMGRMVPAFEAAVVELEVGEVSQPVQTQFGWHVIVLNDKRIPQAPALEDVREEIISSIQTNRVRATIDSAREAGEVNMIAGDGFDHSLIHQRELLD